MLGHTPIAQNYIDEMLKEPKKIIEQLEKCEYECIAGNLETNLAFIALKEFLELDIICVGGISDAPEGRLLLMAIALLSTTTHTDKSPEEIIAELKKMDIRTRNIHDNPENEIKHKYTYCYKFSEKEEYNKTVDIDARTIKEATQLYLQLARKERMIMGGLTAFDGESILEPSNSKIENYEEVPEYVNCNKCKYINITEEEQTDNRIDHICTYTGMRVFHRMFVRHRQHAHAHTDYIHPCTPCSGELFEEREGK